MERYANEDSAESLEDEMDEDTIIKGSITSTPTHAGHAHDDAHRIAQKDKPSPTDPQQALHQALTQPTFREEEEEYSVPSPGDV